MKLAARAGYSRRPGDPCDTMGAHRGSEGRSHGTAQSHRNRRRRARPGRPNRASGSRSPSTTCCASSFARRASERDGDAQVVRPSPRDIQTHIRAGLSADEVAALLGARVEDVARFEGPVLAEREHVVGQALAVPVLLGAELEPDVAPDLRRRRPRQAGRGRRLRRTLDELEGDDRLGRQARVHRRARSTMTRGGASTRAAARSRR